MLWTRPDGSKVRDVSALRRFMPYLLRTRNESYVLFEQELDLTRTLRYLAAANAANADSGGAGPADDSSLKLFHVILCAMARLFARRPQLNRFVTGGTLYQRRHIELSFAIKKQHTDSGGLTTTKLRLRGDETPREIADAVQSAVRFGRSDKQSQADRETALVVRLPGPFLRLLLWLQRGLDAWNLLPASLIEPDPLYCSIFLANLGSIGLDSAYHHLFEYGTCSFFAVVGKVRPKREPDYESGGGGDDGREGGLVVRETLSIKYTFDERITDGWYCARSLELFRDWVEDPQQLDERPDSAARDGAPRDSESKE